MRRTAKRKRRGILGKAGQGMTEYIIITALIALAAIVAVAAFGGKIKDWFTKAAETIEDIPTGEMEDSESSSKGKSKGIGSF